MRPVLLLALFQPSQQSFLRGSPLIDSLEIFNSAVLDEELALAHQTVENAASEVKSLLERQGLPSEEPSNSPASLLHHATDDAPSDSQIFIKDPRGRVLTAHNIQPGDTVGSMKQTLGIPNQQLIFKGGTLEDNRALVDYGIEASKTNVGCSGVRVRSRTILQRPKFGGKPCPPLVQVVACVTPASSTLILSLPSASNALANSELAKAWHAEGDNWRTTALDAVRDDDAPKLLSALNKNTDQRTAEPVYEDGVAAVEQRVMGGWSANDAVDAPAMLLLSLESRDLAGEKGDTLLDLVMKNKRSSCLAAVESLRLVAAVADPLRTTITYPAVDETRSTSVLPNDAGVALALE